MRYELFKIVSKIKILVIFIKHGIFVMRTKLDCSHNKTGGYMVIAAKISSKRQVTIPLKVMVRLRLTPGDQLIFEDKGGHMEVKPKAEKFTLKDFLNKRKGRVTKKLTDDEIRKARQEAWEESETNI
jgi:AbrB family looped-hinge helix DNA binding protein